MQDNAITNSPTITPGFVSDALVGRTPSGLRVFLTLEIRAPQGTGTVMSTTHQEIERPLELSVAGGTVGRRADVESAGQIIDEVRTAVPHPDSSWTQADLDSVVAIWDRWHLNDLRAGCVHQPPESVVWETEPYRRIDLENTPRCPETGYKYASAWLSEVVPDDVLVEFSRLIALPAGPAPAWLRR